MLHRTKEKADVERSGLLASFSATISPETGLILCRAKRARRATAAGALQNVRMGPDSTRRNMGQAFALVPLLF